MAEAHDHDPDDVVTVTQARVTVEKRFTTDEFPVPAVTFVLRSEAEEPVDVRLTDEVPESLEMERIGFHPEYEGDAWTAYRDHRVEYERTVAPGEEVTTVYGVRIDGPETDVDFLGEPRIERIADAPRPEKPEEILGRETTGAVRDALAGEGDLAEDDDAGDVVDLDEPMDVTDDVEDVDLDLDVDEPEAAEFDLDETGAEEIEEAELDLADPGSASVEGATSAPEPSPDEGEEVDGADGAAGMDGADGADGTAGMDGADGADGPAGMDGTDGADGAEGTEETAGGDAAADLSGDAAESVEARPESVAAALAAEVREGTADEDDLAVLREAVAPERESEPEVPRSVEVRIDRLQNRTEDLAAYTDALETFLDEEGTGQEVLDDLDATTATLREDLDAVTEETADLGETVGDHGERLADLEATANDLEERVGTLDDGLDDLGSTVADVEAEVDDLAGDTDASVAELREAIDDLETTAADMEDELDELKSFRDRMRDAFGS
ncbi:MAG: hypothetical protein ABEJ81_06225 [Haloferacaceae archaeon]